MTVHPYQIDNAGRRVLRLGDYIAMLSLTERDWTVLDARCGFSKRLSLDDTAKLIGGVTRERARQIQRDAAQKIRRRLLTLQPALDALNAAGSALHSVSRTTTSVDTAISLCRNILTAAGWSESWEKDVHHLFLALRAVTDLDGCTDDTPLYYMTCSLHPPIVAYPRVATDVARRDRLVRELGRRRTYAELAAAVLKDAGEPLHWSEMASRAEKLGLHKTFNDTGFFNALSLASETFARVGQGTYGLTEWSLTNVATYPDIIAQTLRDAGRALTYGELLQRVEVIRPIKKGSLQLFLDTHARFYRSPTKMYGLRAWLLPRHKQTLRTPSWQVEGADSVLRVQKAEAKGVDVASMVEQDKLPRS